MVSRPGHNLHSRNDAFINVPVKCPMCDQNSTQRYVKSKLFQVQETESDQHVTVYKWEHPKFEGIRPNFYHIWHCPHCHYCDEREVFRGVDASGGKQELLRDKLLAGARDPNSFISIIGNMIDFSDQFVMLDIALITHLLATYEQELLSANNRQYGKLGRFYLRTAWIYREKTAWQIPDMSAPPGYETFTEFLAAMAQKWWPEMPLNEQDAIKLAITNYRSDLDRSAQTEEIRRDVNVMFLVADLAMRINDFDLAMGNIRNIFQQCTRKRQATKLALDSGRATGSQREALQSLATWLQINLDRAVAISEEINAQILTVEYPKARELVLEREKKEGTVDLKQMLQLLREKKFHEVTCRRTLAVYNKGLLAKLPMIGLQPDDTERGFSAEATKAGGLFGKLAGIFGGKKDDDEEDEDEEDEE